MHVALARKWRPQLFEDVIGQRGVVDTLKNAITTGRLAQSFIFAGPRGVGKTTTARILARALNCVEGPTPEPCGKCDACIEISEGRDVDVLEIDAATHTQVDNVRAVIVEPLSSSPMRNRFKIFIIDEATETVTGTIPMQTGTPRNLTLSSDGKRFYLLSTKRAQGDA